MPTAAQFSERTYETAVNAALARPGSGTCPACGAGGHGVEVWAPGQVLEKTVGFDAAISFDNPAVVGAPWQHGLTAAQAQEAASAPAVASIFVQYKRPEGMTNLKAAMNGSITSPYRRFLLVPHQHDTLTNLRGALGGLADVGYVAANFLTSAELRLAISSATILDQSAFLVVPAPAPGVTHREGAFDDTHAGFFSDPDLVPRPTFLASIGEAAALARQRESFGVHRHVLRLGHALAPDTVQSSWADHDDEDQIRSAATVVFERANASGATWMLLADRRE